MNDNKNTNNIELAYSYTEDFIKDRKNEIKHLDWRLGTFLGFAGLLLRFGIDLPNTEPSYLLTQLGVLVTSSFSVITASWALRLKSDGRFVTPSYLMENKCFAEETLSIKAMIINTHKEASNKLDKLAIQKQTYLNKVILCLAASASFFTLNGILVAVFEN